MGCNWIREGIVARIQLVVEGFGKGGLNYQLGGGVDPWDRRRDLPLGMVGGSSHILPQAGRDK